MRSASRAGDHIGLGTSNKRPTNNSVRFIEMLRAILTDAQFWIPVGVLAVGVALLAWLH
jgi:hypothetical protein